MAHLATCPGLQGGVPPVSPGVVRNGSLSPCGYNSPQPGVFAPGPSWRPTPASPQHVASDTAVPPPGPPLAHHLGAPQLWGGPATPKRGRPGRAWGAAGGVVVTAMAVAAVVGLIGHHPETVLANRAEISAPSALPTVVASPPVPSTAPSAESLVDDGDLVGLVPTPAEVAAVMGVGRLESNEKLNGPGMFTDPASPVECTGVVMPDARAAYAGSGVHVNYMQAWRDPDSPAMSIIVTGLSTFDSGSAAAAFVDQQSTTWPTCSLKPIVVGTDDERGQTWDVSTVAKKGDTLVADLSMRHIPGRCEHALAARRNVVIDVVSCSQHPDGTAAALTSTVIKRLGWAI